MYLFTSERLGFRNWTDEDLDLMAAINADPEVMRYFPSLQDREQTKAFIERMQQLYADKGFCYFAVELLHSREFIGFTGFAIPQFKAHFTPCIDMGWRLATSHQGNGYATEAATACLEYGFTKLGLTEVVAICPAVNKASENVMKKIGMTFREHFNHPLLKDNDYLEKCCLYSYP